MKQLKQIVAAFILGFVLLLTPFVSSASAAPTSPASYPYNSNVTDYASKDPHTTVSSYGNQRVGIDQQEKSGKISAKSKGNDLVKNSQKKLKGAAKEVKEKLNLDEPIAPETKKFGRQIKEKASEIFDR